MNEIKEVYTLEEVAQIAKTTQRTLYRWVKEGKLPAVKFGKQWRVTHEDLQYFMSKGTEKR